jgi:hypothetical protein
MPGFVTNKGNKLFIAPIESVFRGYLFESTAGSREDFYFWWFFMPMVPATDHFYLTHGERLRVPRGDTGWRTDMDDLPEKLLAAMQPRAMPILRSINSISDAIREIYKLRLPGEVTDINHLDNLACLMILDGQYKAAADVLDKIVAHEHGDDQRQWVLDIVNRIKDLRTELTNDPDRAVRQVRQWQDSTFKSLKLETWR